MKKLLILSGKGGTGKTTVSSSFIKLSGTGAYADCDVDAPNLHLMVKKPDIKKETDFFGLLKARINSSMCVNCGLCMDNCEFEAIHDADGYSVDFYSCEGCGVCQYICPAHAITLNPAVAGNLILYKDEKVFSTAKLNAGFGNSGLLVSEVKRQLDTEAHDMEFAIIDGSPGIGCPVIASISGMDMVLIVAEPSLSGISDMIRVIETAENFMVPLAVCINKFDINVEKTEDIENFCIKSGIPITGRIPFDPTVSYAINTGTHITDIECSAGNALKHVYKSTMQIFKTINKEIIYD